jgi:hypothetical protein
MPRLPNEPNVSGNIAPAVGLAKGPGLSSALHRLPKKIRKMTAAEKAAATAATAAAQAEAAVAKKKAFEYRIMEEKERQQAQAQAAQAEELKAKLQAETERAAAIERYRKQQDALVRQREMRVAQEQIEARAAAAGRRQGYIEHIDDSEEEDVDANTLASQRRWQMLRDRLGFNKKDMQKKEEAAGMAVRRVAAAAHGRERGGIGWMTKEQIHQITEQGGDYENTLRLINKFRREHSVTPPVLRSAKAWKEHRAKKNLEKRFEKFPLLAKEYETNPDLAIAKLEIEEKKLKRKESREQAIKRLQTAEKWNQKPIKRSLGTTVALPIMDYLGKKPEGGELVENPDEWGSKLGTNLRRLECINSEENEIVHDLEENKDYCRKKCPEDDKVRNKSGDCESKGTHDETESQGLIGTVQRSEELEGAIRKLEEAKLAAAAPATAAGVDAAAEVDTTEEAREIASAKAAAEMDEEDQTQTEQKLNKAVHKLKPDRMLNKFAQLKQEKEIKQSEKQARAKTKERQSRVDANARATSAAANPGAIYPGGKSQKKKDDKLMKRLLAKHQKPEEAEGDGNLFAPPQVGGKRKYKKTKRNRKTKTKRTKRTKRKTKTKRKTYQKTKTKTRKTKKNKKSKKKRKQLKEKDNQYL